ncbi:MAG: PucR family transcriptional regulator ligand-binding domain-containing protein [Clostridiales bacterium]|nr:PucR family transcriptional regulator ligand-binding domain-containing protein [Clostridiales bacterium]
MQNKVGVKVSEILELEFFKNAIVLCGEKGLDNYIAKVNVMEVPDIIDWVKPGEFLLTTAYSIKDDILKLNELIPVMKRIGVAGLGIKTKRYIEKLPQSVLDTANAHDLPVISIPLDLSFGDIISNILTSVVNRQMKVLVQIDEFNTRLKEIMLRGGELNEIALMIEGVVNAPVAIYEEIFKDYVCVAEDRYRTALNDIIESIFIKKTSKSRQGYGRNDIKEHEDIIDGVTIKRLMIPIYSDDISYGYVIIWDVNNNIPDATLVMIEAATSLIALNSSKKLSVYENENKHKIDFIEELLSSQETQQMRAVEKASYFDFNIGHIYGVLLVSIDKTYTEVAITPNNAKMLKQLNSKLISVVERLHRFYKGEMIYGNKSDRVIFLLGYDQSVDETCMKKNMLQVGEELLKFARLENIHNKISIGLGRTYGDYKDLYKSYREAQRSVHKIGLSKEDNKILHFDELGIYRILSNEEVQPEIQQFFIETLGNIVAYDREKDAELLETLKMYYACGCNLKRVSEEMYTHYNTVIYRIQRIKEIGNIDFSDPNVSLNVHIALKILDVINLDNIIIEKNEKESTWKR